MSRPARSWSLLGGPATRLQLRDHVTEYSELRLGHGPNPQVLLLVHAALLDRHLWAEFAERLGAELTGRGDWRIIGYDLRGHGAARDAPPITGIDQLAADLADLLGTLAVPRAHLAGLSLGGAVAQAAALAAPNRVASLTLVGTSCRFPAEIMERRAQLSDAGVAGRVPETLRRWFRPETLTAASPAADYAREHVLTTPLSHWAQTWRALGGFDVAARLPEITAPVLAVAGAEDSASPPAALRQIADGVAHGRLIVIDQAAHLLTLERPAALAAHVGAFLRDLNG